MFLSIKEAELRQVRFDVTFEPGKIDFFDAGVWQATPLHAQGTARVLPNTGGELRIQGRLEVSVECECDRCLNRTQFVLNSPFDLFYRPAERLKREQEIEIDEGEAQIGFYDGAGMELTDILREQVLLLLPMQRTCREDCKGICPSCGRNRNEASCNCHVVPSDDRWGALRNLEI